MKAMIIENYGAPDVFKPINIPQHSIAPHEVLIHVAASSVNPVDCKIRAGDYGIIGPTLPAILHGDVAGTIAEIGAQVSRFKVGDEVYGCAGGFKGLAGALAEYMVADAALLALKPQTLNMTSAAALPLVAITAWEGLIRLANIKVGQHVLVHAGTGGVGHIAIQLAKNAGAFVYTTCSSPQKATIAKDLGADYVIHYREQGVDDYIRQYTNGNGFDVVFDTVGGDVLAQSLQAARIYGQVATIQAATTVDLTPFFFKNLSLHAVYMPSPLLTGVGRSAYGEILSIISQLVDAGRIKPLIDSIFSMNDVAKAHQHLESGKAIGKIVLTQSLD